MRSFAGRLRRGVFVPACFGLLIFVSGCTPPVVRTTGGAEDGRHFKFLHWEDGGMLLVVDDLKGLHIGKGGSSGEGGYTWSQSVGLNDGLKNEWKFETTDGQVVRFHIDEKEYDLSKGSLFIIKANGEQNEVHQLTRDLSTIQFNPDACREFLKKDVEIQNLFGAGDVSE